MIIHEFLKTHMEIVHKKAENLLFYHSTNIPASFFSSFSECKVRMGNFHKIRLTEGKKNSEAKRQIKKVFYFKQSCTQEVLLTLTFISKVLCNLFAEFAFLKKKKKNQPYWKTVLTTITPDSECVFPKSIFKPSTS